MDLLHLVDRLEELVAEAQKMPIGNRVIIDRRRLLDLVDQMRVSVPQEVRDAQDIVRDRDQIKRETEEESRLIIARAEEEVARRVDGHELTVAARERAQEIAQETEVRLEDRVRQANEDIQHRIEESRHLARQQMQAADEYARELLLRLDRQLQAFVGSVQSGIEQLEPERELPPEPVPGEFDPGPVDPGNFDSDGALGSLPEDEVDEVARSPLVETKAPEPEPTPPAPPPPATDEDDTPSVTNRGAIELPAASADREAMPRAEERSAHTTVAESVTPQPTAPPRDPRSGFGQTAPPEPPLPSAPSGGAELEDLLGRARETAEAAALEAALETDEDDDDVEVIDDFAHPPLDDDPLQADELAAERQAEERASRGNGDR